MPKQYEEYTLEKLLTIFCKYVPVNNKTLCNIFKVNEINLDNVFVNIDLSKFDDKQIHSLEGIVFNKLNKDTFDKEVPADKREYCWDVGLEILKRYESELTLRHPEELTELESFVRTSSKKD